MSVEFGNSVKKIQNTVKFFLLVAAISIVSNRQVILIHSNFHQWRELANLKPWFMMRTLC